VHLLRGKVDYRPVAYDGIEAELRDGRPIVDSVQSGSPADAAGFRSRPAAMVRRAW